MSSIVQDELSNLTNNQLRLRLLQHGLANMPVTDTTRDVLLKKLRKTINGQSSEVRRETIHVPKYSSGEEDEEKPAPKKTNRRVTVGIVPVNTNDVAASVAKPKNARRSGRITPTIENRNATSIAVPPTENDIPELDEQSVPEVYIKPKRTSRSPSLGKSQTVVTSYKTEITKPTPIIEIDDEDEVSDSNDDDGDADIINSYQSRNLYPSLGKDNGLNSAYPTSPSKLGRTTTYTTTYEPTSHKSSSHDSNFDDLTSFKAPLAKPRPSTSYSNYDKPVGVTRRYTTNAYTSKHLAQNYEDESGTEHSDIEAPYLSDFARRLTQLKAEPLNRKILHDVKQQNRQANDSLWHSFVTLVIAFGRKFGSILLGFMTLMVVVFVYVFFIMG